MTRIYNWNFESIATFTVQLFVAEYLRKKCGDLNEVASDNDDDKGDGDANSKDIEVVEFGKGEALTMLDNLVNLKCISREERNSLVTMKDKLEKIRMLNKKQNHIDDYFILE